MGEGESAVIRWLEPSSFRARWEPEACRLSARVGEGREIADARAALAFPVSAPEELIEISSSKGESAGMLRSLEGLDEETHRALRAALENRYLIPKVRRVLELVEAAPFVLHWRVETDRGPRAFHTESPREAVKYQGADRIRVTDLAGNHYDVPSISGLDAEGRALLDVFL